MLPAPFPRCLLNLKKMEHKPWTSPYKVTVLIEISPSHLSWLIHKYLVPLVDATYLAVSQNDRRRGLSDKILVLMLFIEPRAWSG